MVDQEARRQYAELVRQFTSGRMTIDEYEERFIAIRLNKKDPAISKICDRLGLLYENAQPDKLTKQWRLDPVARRKVAQAVLFLQSGEEYQWREELWDGSVFLITAFLVFLLFALFPETALINRAGIAAVLVSAWINYERWQGNRQQKRHPMAGDTGAWPFLHQADLDEAVKHPHLLNGGR